MLGEGAARSGLLHSISDEALANTTATPSSASFRFVQLLAEVCARTGAPGGSGRGPCDGERGREGPPPRRPQPPAPVLAPALALAAAAAGRCVTPQLEAQPLEAPAALAGFQGDWLALQPAVLPFWDKVSLEPCGPQKAVEFYVVCPEQHSSAARMFVKDVSATFLGMRLGSHQPARTPSHLHAIDGVVPVPADPGPGPPVGGAQGDGDAVAAAAAWQQQQALALARRPDRLVLRSAVLGFRSNHATTSVAGDLGWEPDEPSYRPRAGAASGAGAWQGMAMAAAATGGAAAGMAAPPQPAAAARQQPATHVHFWRNLRHVGRQLQRHLLLQPPRELRQLNQQPRGVSGGAGGAGRGLSGGGAPGGGGPVAKPEAGGAGVGVAGTTGAGGAGSTAPGDPSMAGAAVGSGMLDLGPAALVVYVVPPSDSVDDVAAALMEVAACLAPVCPASRMLPARVPLAAPPGADAGALGAELQAGPVAGQAAAIARGQTGGAGARLGPGTSAVAWPGCHSVSSSVCGPGLVPGGGMVPGSVTLSSAGAGAALMALAAAGPPTGTSSSAASTPPEAPACSVGPSGVPAAAGAGAAGAVDGSSGPGAAEGTGPNASGDTTDPALLARLGGAARHLYRATSWPAPAGTGGGSGGGAAMAAAAAAAGPVGSTPQLDLTQLAATELVIQLVLPSSLYDVTGACVRATACAAYTKLCRRLAGYGAAAATKAAAANASAGQGLPSTRRAQPAQELASRHVHGEGGGGTAPASIGGAAVQASCSGRTPVYEPLLALAPPQALALAAAAAEATGHPAGAGAGGEAAATARARSPAPASLHGGAGGASVMAPGAVAAPVQPQPAPDAASAHAAALAASERPTLHCCYAWQRCSGSNGRASEGAAASRAAAGLGGFAGATAELERCWLALAFCDSEGRVLDTRAMSLCSSSSSGDSSNEGMGMDMGTAAAVDGLGSGDVATAPGAGHEAVTAAAATAAPVAAVAGDAASCRSSLLPAGSSTSAMAAALGPAAGPQQADGGGGGGGSSSSLLALRTPCSCSMETDACPTAGEAERQSQPAPESLPPLALDALVCRVVLGHAQMLRRQLAGAGGSSIGGGGGAGAAAGGHTDARAAAAADEGLAPGAPAAQVTIAVTKLGSPTDAEAAAWQRLLTSRDSGSCGSSSRNSSSSSDVSLSWLQLHPSVAVPQGFRVPPGGYVVRHAGAPSGPGAGAAAAATPAPVTLCAFPTQQPPSAACAATEGLSRHLRMLSVHTWPRPQHRTSPPPPQHQNHSHHQQQQGPAAQVDAVMADGAEPTRDVSAQPELEAAAKRRRLDPARDPGAGANAGAGALAGVTGAGCCWSDPSLALLRQLAALCSLRDAMLAAQSGARGGPTPGGRYAAAAPTAGGAAAAGSDVTLLLPLHVAVCQRLLRALVVCERLAAASSGAGAMQSAAPRRAGP